MFVARSRSRKEGDEKVDVAGQCQPFIFAPGCKERPQLHIRCTIRAGSDDHYTTCLPLSATEPNFRAHNRLPTRRHDAVLFLPTLRYKFTSSLPESNSNSYLFVYAEMKTTKGVPRVKPHSQPPRQLSEFGRRRRTRTQPPRLQKKMTSRRPSSSWL